MTGPGVSVARSAAERSLIRRILTSNGEIRPVIVAGITGLVGLVCLVMACELAVVLLSLGGVEIFKYLLGPSLLSWLAHRIYL